MCCVSRQPPGGQEGVLGVLTLLLGSGLVWKQRKGIRASHGVCCSHRKHIPVPGSGGGACVDAELAAAFRFPAGAGRGQLYLNLPQNPFELLCNTLKLVTDLVLV